MISNSPSKALVIWLWMGIAMILIMVVIGGLTRLTHSGLSMVHWTFTGSLPPIGEQAWMEEFGRYQASPEFKELHSHFNLSDFKSIFWWEYLHRMFGRLIGVVFLIPFGWFLWQKKIPKNLLPKFFVILGLGAFQALLGWFMVKSGLADVPRVSHFRLSAHLTTAFITCAYIFWVLLEYKQINIVTRKSSRPLGLILLLGGLLIMQIIYGGFVAGLKAGSVHNTWPLMDGSFISPAVWAMDSLTQSFLEAKSGVQFIHRTIGLLLLGVSLWVMYSHKNDEQIKKPIMLFGTCIIMQFGLGVMTLLWHTPIEMAVTHQVFALVTLLCWVWVFKATWSHAPSE